MYRAGQLPAMAHRYMAMPNTQEAHQLSPRSEPSGVPRAERLIARGGGVTPGLPQEVLRITRRPDGCSDRGSSVKILSIHCGALPYGEGVVGPLDEFVVHLHCRSREPHEPDDRHFAFGLVPGSLPA
jgi:hypothetical protein